MESLWLYFQSLYTGILVSTGFSPSDSLEKAQADMIFDGVEDLRAGMSKFYFEKDEVKKVGTCDRRNLHSSQGVVSTFLFLFLM